MIILEVAGGIVLAVVILAVLEGIFRSFYD